MEAKKQKGGKRKGNNQRRGKKGEEGGDEKSLPKKGASEEGEAVGDDGGEGDRSDSTTPYVEMIKKKLYRSCTPEDIDMVTNVHRLLQKSMKSNFIIIHLLNSNLIFHCEDEKGPVDRPKEGKLIALFDQLEDFNGDAAEWQLDFPATLNSRDRAVLHELAGKLGFEHSRHDLLFPNFLASLYPSLSLSSHTNTHSLSHSHTLSHTLTLSPSLTLSLSHTLSCCPYLTPTKYRRLIFSTNGTPQHGSAD